MYLCNSLWTKIKKSYAWAFSWHSKLRCFTRQILWSLSEFLKSYENIFKCTFQYLRAYFCPRLGTISARAATQQSRKCLALSPSVYIKTLKVPEVQSTGKGYKYVFEYLLILVFNSHVEWPNVWIRITVLHL